MKVEFVGYASDCVISGEVELESDRLTDLLSGRDEYVVTKASLEVLDSDRVVELESVNVLRDDLCAVTALGPRGNASRRIRTRPFPIRAKVGSYDVFGYIHAMPTADPVSTALRRFIIPMTSGWIRYELGGKVVEREHDGLLLNRSKIDWLEQASDEDALLPKGLDLPIAIDLRARDLTGELSL